MFPIMRVDSIGRPLRLDSSIIDMVSYLDSYPLVSLVFFHGASNYLVSVWASLIREIGRMVVIAIPTPVVTLVLGVDGVCFTLNTLTDVL